MQTLHAFSFLFLNWQKVAPPTRYPHIMDTILVFYCLLCHVALFSPSLYFLYQDASKVSVCLLSCRESAKVMANKLQNWVTGNYRKATVGVNVHMSNAKIIILSALCLNCVKIVKTGKIEHCQCVVHLTFWIKRRELIMSTEAKARSRFFQSGMKLAFWSHTHFRQKEKYRKHNFDLAPCGRKTEKRNAMQNTKPLFLEMQVYTRCNSYKGENKDFFNEI